MDVKCVGCLDLPDELPVFMYFFVVATSAIGTLTQNEMIFKRLHLGTVSYGTDTMDEIQSHVMNSYSQVS